ncbi:uncharacterized protein LY89DRAFT_276883 [Mollisia scopiformis]|uniref:Uncharacterized protein n=1 Tax=Mollisia scopiformis TaxID=149040 RepID=A0A132BBH4_MOLSC|nr:uncharacterized protein LY89DRAFT_276883 [Mollisia scopiformis]KUJ09765.1 hypothetical protein LY89DRAFT_276883 [Mollisia scopiformis]
MSQLTSLLVVAACEHIRQSPTGFAIYLARGLLIFTTIGLSIWTAAALSKITDPSVITMIIGNFYGIIWWWWQVFCGRRNWWLWADALGILIAFLALGFGAASPHQTGAKYQKDKSSANLRALRGSKATLGVDVALLFLDLATFGYDLYK